MSFSNTATTATAHVRTFM